MNEETIFHLALETPTGERTALLDNVCQEDADLRRRIERLLAEHERGESFILDTPPVNLSATIDSPITERPGTLIGPYKLLQQIGEGGMGVVFMAEQTEPIQRSVALKIIKPGMDTRQVIARFEAERQALALMDHPNIAKVLDAATTETGRPYFVMELVKGVPITEFCDEKQLPVRERLGLFKAVCEAVQHAHQKGIIHRDLKPTNVLVAEYDNRAVPKVIDFGVAKATAQKLSERTMFTEFGQVIGTVEYMSPEQAKFNQLDIDTRSDIYSLGVLLYELLTGSTPFERERLRSAAIDEVLRIIREEDPPKPSTRLSSQYSVSHRERAGVREPSSLASVAANRQTEPARLSKEVSGELDWIAMKCLEKDRNRRYATASGLAGEIERYLRDEPVQACPPSAVYRFRKFARRNKTALLLASAGITTLLLLIAGLAISNRLIANERNEKAAALVDREAALADREIALAQAKAESERAEENFLRSSIAIREVLTKAAIGAGEWSQLPAPLRKRFSEEAVKFYESLLQEDSPNPNRQYEAAVGYRSIGTLHTTTFQPQRAEEAFRRSVAILDSLVTKHPANPQYRQQLGWSLLNFGRTLRNTARAEEAKTALLRGVELYEKLLSEVPSSFDYRNELATCYLELNRCHVDTGDLKRAAETIDLAIRMLESAVAQQPEPQFQEQLAGMHLSLGKLRARNGQIEEAKAAYREAAQRYEAAFSTRQSAGILYHWAETYQGLMELPNNDPKLAMADAEQAYQKFLQVRSLTPAELKDHHDLRERFGHAHRACGFMLRGAGRPKEAEQAFVEAAMLFDKLTTDAPNVAKYRDYAADTHRLIAELLTRRGRHEEAEREFRRSVEVHEELLAKFPKWMHNEHTRAASYFDLARLLIKTGRMSEAVPLVSRGVEVNPENNGQPIELQAQVKLGDLLREAGEFDQALVKYSEVVATKPDLAEAWAGRGECNRRLGDFAKMAEDYSAAIELKPGEQWYWHERGYAYLVLGEHEKSIADHSQSIVLGDTDAGQRQRRGTSYEALGDFAKAEQDYSRAIELGPREWWTWHSRARLYRKQGNSDKAQSDLANAAKFANDPDAQNEIAWKLVTDPDPSWRNAKLAVELAERAIGARPGDGLIWNTVGAARYRNGQWKDAIAAFEKSMELHNGGESNDWFVLAMCHWQLGDKEQARVWYDKAVEWMDKNQPHNAELARFRDEATQLIKNHTEATTQEKTE